MRHQRATGCTDNYEVISSRTCAANRGRINFMHRKPGACRRMGNWPLGIQHVLEKEAERTNTAALSTTDLIFMRKTHLRSSVKCLKLGNFNTYAFPRWDPKNYSWQESETMQIARLLPSISKILIAVCFDTFQPAYQKRHLSFSSYFRWTCESTRLR